MNPPDQTTRQAARQRWMALLAKAPPARLAALLPSLPAHQHLRQPEVGAVMVRGRVGGTAEPFNLGEMTVTRASVQLADGAVRGGEVVLAAGAIGSPRLLQLSGIGPGEHLRQLGVPVVTAFQVCRLVAVLLMVGPLFKWVIAHEKTA